MIQKYNPSRFLNCIVTQKHPGRVESVSFNSNHEVIYSWSRLVTENRNIYLAVWDVKTGKLLHTLKGEFETALCLDICPQEQLLVSCRDNIIKVWDLQTLQSFYTFKVDSSHIYCVALSKDGKTIFSNRGNEADATIDVWNWKQGKLVYSFEGNLGKVWSFTKNYDQPICLSFIHNYRTVKVWNFRTGKNLYTLETNSSVISCLTISKDGNFLVGGDGTPQFILWDLQTGKKLVTLNTKSYAIESLAITPDAKTIICGSCDGTITGWDWQMGQEIFRVKQHRHRVRSLSLCSEPDRILLASGSWDHSIKLWELR